MQDDAGLLTVFHAHFQLSFVPSRYRSPGRLVTFDVLTRCFGPGTADIVVLGRRARVSARQTPSQIWDTQRVADFSMHHDATGLQLAKDEVVLPVADS
jgi:hypothetical protein